MHDIKVIYADERLFVAMPSRKDNNRNLRDIVHLIYSDSRDKLENSILEKYNEQINDMYIQQLLLETD